MDGYTDAKARIFENQGEGDFLVLNYDDPVISHLNSAQLTGQRPSMPSVYFFSRYEAVDGLYARDGVVYCNFSHGELSDTPHSFADSLAALAQACRDAIGWIVEGRAR